MKITSLYFFLFSCRLQTFNFSSAQILVWIVLFVLDICCFLEDRPVNNYFNTGVLLTLLYITSLQDGYQLALELEKALKKSHELGTPPDIAASLRR